jgi:hypothetical protein
MDKFVIVGKRSSVGRATNDRAKRHKDFKPYDTKKHNEKPRVEKSEAVDFHVPVSDLMSPRYLAPVMKDTDKPSSSALTKHLLNTLSHESNPITHSDIGKRSGMFRHTLGQDAAES